MNDLSNRFRQAVEFLERNGYAKNDSDIARRIGRARSVVCECQTGVRVPNWGVLLDFCDAYPINFWWLRTGAGGMIKEERERDLLRRIEELEAEVARLKG